MPSSWRLLHQALDAFGLLASKTQARSRARFSLKLVALPAPNLPPIDPLRNAAQELVQAYDDYLANSDKRFDRRFRRYGKETFFDRFAMPWLLARRAYCQAAIACADPFHEHLATLLECNFWPWAVWGTDDPPVRILKNWLREEPRIETQPAEGWVAQTSLIVQFARERPTSSYAATLTLEVKQSLPELVALCVDVDTDVSIASVLLVLEREASSKSADLLWKESRIWVIVEDPRLREGDRINITLTSARPITQSTSVRIGKAARMASVAH